jgi:molecular chaperone GrpE
VTDVLADFQRWYEQALTQGELPPPPLATLDLATLLGHFVALRQEVNLQTRSVRAGQEQTAEFFRRLAEGIDSLARVRAKPDAPDPKETVRPLLKTLVDLQDALSLAGQQIQRVQATVLPLLDELIGAEPPGPPMPAPSPVAPRSFWSRWFLSPSADAALRASQEQTQQALVQLHEERRIRQEKARRASEALDRIRQALGGLVTGYTMSVERIERALEQHGLEPIPTVGQTFDPELMEVVEAVENTGRPSGEVLEEVRRGYRHDGRVFRYAQVRVVRS